MFQLKRERNEMARRALHEKPMTPAERARRYRDRKRGCAPYRALMTKAAAARLMNVSRTSVWRASVVSQFAPELKPLVAAGNMRLARAFNVAYLRRTRAILDAAREKSA